jgi:hypothetical protein
VKGHQFHNLLVAGVPVPVKGLGAEKLLLEKSLQDCRQTCTSCPSQPCCLEGWFLSFSCFREFWGTVADKLKVGCACPCCSLSRQATPRAARCRFVQICRASPLWAMAAQSGSCASCRSIQKLCTVRAGAVNQKQAKEIDLCVLQA